MSGYHPMLDMWFWFETPCRWLGKDTLSFREKWKNVCWWKEMRWCRFNIFNKVVWLSDLRIVIFWKPRYSGFWVSPWVTCEVVQSQYSFFCNSSFTDLAGRIQLKSAQFPFVFQCDRMWSSSWDLLTHFWGGLTVRRHLVWDAGWSRLWVSSSILGLFGEIEWWAVLFEFFDVRTPIYYFRLRHFSVPSLSRWRGLKRGDMHLMLFAPAFFARVSKNDWVAQKRNGHTSEASRGQAWWVKGKEIEIVGVGQHDSPWIGVLASYPRLVQVLLDKSRGRAELSKVFLCKISLFKSFSELLLAGTLAHIWGGVNGSSP